jgi:acetylornithine deacetylase
MHLNTLASIAAFAFTICSARRTAEQQLFNAVDQITTADKLNLTHDLVAFHKGLVEIESITGNEQAVGEWLADSLQSQGYTVHKQYLSKDPVRFNVLAWPGSEKNAKVLVTSHIDTVSLLKNHVMPKLQTDR